jgi:tRNA 2-thiouridine synthesizing protein A
MARTIPAGSMRQSEEMTQLEGAASGMAADQILDVTGLLCPLPVLKARKALSDMRTGQVLKVIATDPAAVIDIPHFCQESGHGLAGQEHDQLQQVFQFWVTCR